MTIIKLSRDFRSSGYAPEELARMARSGQVVRIRRGAYVEPPLAELDPRVADLA